MKDNFDSSYCLLNKIIAFIFLLVSLPLMIFIALTIKFTSKGNVIFKQTRIGHDGKEFIFYKFRTMIEGADKLKEKYRKMSKVDGPVFKINKDPRFTKIGNVLSKTHLDELPQLWNVAKGEMFFVGFRPPTLDEVKKYKKWQMKRFNGWPGITSIWAIDGGHVKYSFDEWIKSDVQYESERNVSNDFNLIIKTIKLFIDYIF